MAGSPRVSTHKTSRKRRHYSMRSMRSPPGDGMRVMRNHRILWRGCTP
jgi:hypothetical protein